MATSCMQQYQTEIKTLPEPASKINGLLLIKQNLL